MKNIKIASLYSGVGGLDYGFHADPFFQIVFANDFSTDACATYRKNFNNPEYLHEGDVREFLYSIPDFNLLLAGFPCPSWSMAGQRKGFDDIRGQEFFTVLAALIKYSPAFFICENVKGLKSHNNGKSLEFMLSAFHNLGYSTHVETVTMSDYGIPQNRQRVLLIGSKLPEFNPKDFIPAKISNQILLKDALSQVGPLTNTPHPNHELHTGTDKKQKWIKILKQGENLKDIPEEEIRKREQNQGFESGPIPKTLMGYRRLDGEKVAPTMMFGNTCLPIHPTEDRSISVREAAYIQGFPLDFKFEGGIAAQYKQVGNAVPPLFSIQLAQAIKKALDKIKEGK